MILFYDDVYLFDISGKFIASRSYKEENPTDLFALLDDGEREFLKDNTLFCGIYPVLLVDSTLGPIFIDCSLCSFYRLLIVIAPRFSFAEIANITKSSLLHRVKPSPAMKEIMENCPNVELDDEHDCFANTLLSLHRGALYYRMYGKTNAEIALVMTEIAYDVAHFCGIDLEVNTQGLREYDLKCEPSPERFKFALIELCLLARNYSAHRKARVDIIFGESTVFFEFGFKLASDFINVRLIEKSQELIHFIKMAEMCLFDCYFEQDEVAFALRGFPTRRSPDSSDLKEGRKEFIYD